MKPDCNLCKHNGYCDPGNWDVSMFDEKGEPVEECFEWNGVPEEEVYGEEYEPYKI